MVCGKEPCGCRCAKCGVAEQSSYYPVDGGLERVSNLTLDTFPMDEGQELGDSLKRQGWKSDEINGVRFRYRMTCRQCLNDLEMGREAWQEIDKERKRLDADSVPQDPYYSQLVGAEESGGDFWKNFTD